MTEPTLDPDWLAREQDRFLSWELLRRHVFHHMEPLPAQEICDRIGANKGYVWRLLKQAGEKARSEHGNIFEQDED